MFIRVNNVYLIPNGQISCGVYKFEKSKWGQS